MHTIEIKLINLDGFPNPSLFMFLSQVIQTGHKFLGDFPTET